MINNRDNEDNDNTIKNIFIGLFSVHLFVGIVCFCVFAYFKWIKGKIKYLKINILIIKHIKMNIKSLEITNYDWDDIIYINDFDVNSLEIIHGFTMSVPVLILDGFSHKTEKFRVNQHKQKKERRRSLSYHCNI